MCVRDHGPQLVGNERTTALSWLAAQLAGGTCTYNIGHGARQAPSSSREQGVRVMSSDDRRAGTQRDPDDLWR